MSELDLPTVKSTINTMYRWVVDGFHDLRVEACCFSCFQAKRLRHGIVSNFFNHRNEVLGRCRF